MGGWGAVTAPHLLCFGFGYTARAWAAGRLAAGWRVSATGRTPERLAAIRAFGADAVPFDTDSLPAGVTHVLCSAPPDEAGDPVLARHGGALAEWSGLAWVGYLSSTAVYGDRGGATVDETARLAPTSARGRRRVAAEAAWLALKQPVHVFRLAGIYGPGRSVLDRVRAGAARRVEKPGHLFSRIHVADAAAVLTASAAAPEPGAVVNVCDDEPASGSAVIAHACALLGREAPPAVPFAEAAKTMSPMARAFWSDNRRVRNARMHRLLRAPLRYPTWREGLAAILAEEGASAQRGRPGPLSLLGLDHVVLRTARPKRLTAFYVDVLGCVVERRVEALGLAQLRAGASLIDLVDTGGELGRAGGAPPGREGRNMDHFCVRVAGFDAAAIAETLAAHGVAAQAPARRYGAEGFGPSLYIEDPDGNVVELKGPPDAAADDDAQNGERGDDS